MNWPKLGLAGVAGAVLGAATIQGLYAQTKPLAYLVVEVDVTDAELYRQYLSKGRTAVCSVHRLAFSFVAVRWMRLPASHQSAR